jgi:membrane protease YdiL (CAAX protease family)
MIMLQNKVQKAILLPILYTAVMAIGMYVMRYIYGYIYGDAEMVRVLWATEIVLTLLPIYFIIKYFSWSEVGFNKINKIHIWWLLPPFIFLAYNWYSFFINTSSASLDYSLIALVAFTTFLVGLSEELVYRGVILKTLLKNTSTLKAIVYSSILFSLLHSVNIIGGATVMSVVFQLVMTFVMGFYFAGLAIKLNNLTLLIIFHFLWDFTLFIVPMVTMIKYPLYANIALLVLAIILCNIVIMKNFNIKTLILRSFVTFIISFTLLGVMIIAIDKVSQAQEEEKIIEHVKTADKQAESIKAEEISQGLLKSFKDIPKSLKNKWAIYGNPQANRVYIYAQGGPLTTLSKGEAIFAFKDVAKINFDDTLLVSVHQYQTLRTKYFKENKITFEEAKEYDIKSVKDLAETIQYFKSKGKEVYVVGVSFGAFVVNGLLADYSMIADKYFVIVGRLKMQKEVWKEFSQGGYYGYKYDNNGNFEIFKSSSEQAGMGSGDSASIEDRNMAKLAAGLGYRNYIKLFQNKDLSNVVYVYGSKDEQVGVLLEDEISFLKQKNVRVVKVNADHTRTSTKFFMNDRLN